MTKARNLDPQELAGRLRVSERTIYRWREAGELPTPFKIQGRSGLVWSVAQIDQWEAERGGDWRRDLGTVQDACKLLRSVAADTYVDGGGYSQEDRRLANVGRMILEDPRRPFAERVQLGLATLAVPWEAHVESPDALVEDLLKGFARLAGPGPWVLKESRFADVLSGDVSLYELARERWDQKTPDAVSCKDFREFTERLAYDVQTEIRWRERHPDCRGFEDFKGYHGYRLSDGPAEKE